MPCPPLFLLTSHRSGGTLLARIYNAHPDIVVWGEHGGLLNKLAEMEEIFRRHWQLSTPLADRGLERFLLEKQAGAGFEPWMSRFDRDRFVAWCRDLVLETFTAGLRPDQGWGVKEIRYHTMETVGFLRTLFPLARFVVLRRDLLQQCLSTMLAGWSLHLLIEAGATTSIAEARRAVDDCAYALVAVDHGLGGIAASDPASVLSIRFEELEGAGDATFRRLYDFAGLAVTPQRLQAAAGVATMRRGESPRSSAHGVLGAAFIETHAPACLAHAAQLIAAEGIDRARLRSRSGIGRYSILVGDHHMAEGTVSTMF